MKSSTNTNIRSLDDTFGGRDRPQARSKRRRIVLAIAGLIVVLPCAFVAWRRGSGNFGTVEQGKIYRSAQLDATGLAAAIERHGIKTVLNLRGPNPDEAWYRAELQQTSRSGATQIDVPLASDQWLSREQAGALLDVLDTCDYPILVHCEFGAERTGLVSALVALLRPGSTLNDAHKQFSLDYLFVAIKEGRVMRAHIDAYERWLSQTGKRHDPRTFRHWIANVYRPGTPSREHWPCNPYPLWVVTKPGGSSPAPRWSSAACPERVAIEVDRAPR